MDGEGLLNDELPNCWECPKCYQGDDAEKGQVGHELCCGGAGCVLCPAVLSGGGCLARLGWRVGRHQCNPEVWLGSDWREAGSLGMYQGLAASSRKIPQQGELTAPCSLAPSEPTSRPRPGFHRGGRGRQVPLPGSKRTACSSSWPLGNCQHCPGHRPTAAASPVGPCPLLWMEGQQLRQARQGLVSLVSPSPG